jgi:superoxide dismutase
LYTPEGHINHDIFWTNLAPEKDVRPPTGELLKGIEARWGGLDKFIAEFNAKTAAVQVGVWVGATGISAQSGPFVQVLFSKFSVCGAPSAV